MGEIITKILDDKELTVFVVKDKITYEDVIYTIDKYLAGKVTKNVIWDFTEGNITGLSPEKIRDIGDYTKKYAAAFK